MPLKTVSASQLKTYLSCPRKWAYDKMLGIRQPKGPHLDLGEAVHKEVEDYILDNKPPAFPSLLEALEHPKFPKPQVAGRHVEQPRDYNMGITLAGVPVRGRIDYHYAEGDTAHIWDWKTSKNFRYCLKPEELAVETQLNIYGLFALEQYGVDKVEYTHGYIKTPDKDGVLVPAFKPVFSGIVGADEVRRTCGSLEPAVEKMVEVFAEFDKTEDISHVKGDTRACKEYGGCFYRDICPFYSNFGADKQGEENTMSLKDKLKNKKAAEAIKPAVASALAEIANIVPPDAPVPEGGLEIPEAPVAPAPTQPAAVPATDPLLQFFVPGEPGNPLYGVNQPFFGLAEAVVRSVPSNPDRTVALRKLIEARDAVIRALVFRPSEV